MNIHVPVLVSIDRREVYELFLPGISERSFRGVSLAELLDDVALHLMETIPKEEAAEMPRYQFCPHIELRKVKVEIELGTGIRQKKVPWKGRLAVVVTRWPKDDFYVATVPRLGCESFAVERTAWLPEALGRFLTQWAADRYFLTNLDPFTCRSSEYLEILEVDTELPTVLPSRPRRKKKKKKKKKGKEKKEKKKEKRRLVPPYTLRKVGINLTHRARDGRLRQAYGREQLVEQIKKHLEREGAAVLLVGPSGVGKTAVVHEVIRRFAQEGQSIHDRSDFWEVDGNRLIAGMSLVGAWERRCQNMVTELRERQDILYVNDLPALVYTGRSAHSDTNVADYIEPHLARGELRLIGECTPERLEATREESPGFFARFRLIPVPELSERESLTVLVHAMRQIEATENVVISPETLEATLALTRRFLVHQCHPGKGMTLLRQLVSDYQKTERDPFGRRKISRDRLVDFFSRQSGLPPFILWEQQARSFEEILAYFQRRIVAQTAATEAVTDVITVLQQGLNDPQRPLANLLFVGPTGVGKTETAKALAEYLFGRADRLIRFDMSEFMDPYSVTRLIGDRFQPEGELTRRVQQQPFCVVLFDEIEKAHPAVFDSLLQVLGEGRLTNAAGHTVDFCNTVILMTSNLGVREASHFVGFAPPDLDQIDEHYRKTAEQFFRPEFFNRIDRVVAFRSLGREAIAPLVRRLLQEILGRRGLRHSSVLVQVDPELVELLIDQGFDPQYGARSMKRLLEQRLTVPLARHLVSHSIHQTTLIQLYRLGEEIGMEIWGLDEEEQTALTGLGPAHHWRQLEERFGQLQEALTQLEESEVLQRFQEEQSTLLVRFNEDDLASHEDERLTSLSELLAQRRDLRDKIDHFQEEYLADYHFIETIDRWIDRSGWREQKFQKVQEVPVAVDRHRIFPLARKELYELRLEMASQLYLFQSLQQRETRTALLRFLPASDDPYSLRWTLSLAREWARCFGRWAAVRGFSLYSGEWKEEETLWEEEGKKEKKEEGDPPKTPWADVEGTALLLQGPGVLAVVQEECGFYQHSHYLGPDLICDLVRVEEVGDGSPPLERLSQLDAQLEAYREGRRQGEPPPNPLPPLPLRRTFQDQICHDPQTGEDLHLPSLGEDLYRAVVLRIFAQFLGQPEA